MTARLDDILNQLLGREGGYANNPDDRGGETMWGITAAVARANGYTGPMRDMPRATAREIYIQRYWVRTGAMKVAALFPSLAEEILDTAVNMGESVPGPWLQRLLNGLNLKGELYPDVKVDGEIGPATLAALETFLKRRGDDGRTVLLRGMNCLQGARYLDITEKREANETFFYGWLVNRVA